MMMNRYRFALVTLLLLHAALARGQQLDSLLESVRSRYDFPALAAAVVNGSGTIASGAVGFRKYGDSTRVTLDDQFHLGSCTKAMTAMVIASLVEEGKLEWGTTIGTIFSGIKIHPHYRNVTLEQLLAHAGGMPEDGAPEGMTLADLYRLPGSPAEQRRRYAALMLKQKPQAKPGTKFIYSNAGFVIAAAMAEEVSGRSWEELISTRIFAPLGMSTAGFGAMGSPGRVEQPWQHEVVDSAHEAVEPGPLSDNPEVIGPAGTVHCSIGDWGRFITACLAILEGKDGIVKTRTLRRAMTPKYGGTYALGWMSADREWGGGRVLTHAGSNTRNFAVVWMAPAKDLAVVIATNQAGGNTPRGCDELAGLLLMRYLAPSK